MDSVQGVQKMVHKECMISESKIPIGGGRPRPYKIFSFWDD